MELPIAQPLQTLLDAGAHRFAALWAIVRTDGVSFHFTDHDTPLTYNGNTYTPANGFNASARQQTTGLSPHNLEVIGIIDSAAITHDDLRAGLFRDASITEYIVDWRTPWAGPLMWATYWLDNITLVNESWQGQIVGLTRYLQPYVGSTYTRTCRHVLGDSDPDTGVGCNVNLATGTSSRTVNSVDATYPRKIFTTTAIIGAGVDYYTNGSLVFTSGLNNGFKGEIKAFNNTTGTVTLQLSAPYAITAGDTYSITFGCDQTLTTCAAKFSNVPNFGGFPNVPGQDRAFSSPVTM